MLRLTSIILFLFLLISNALPDSIKKNTPEQLAIAQAPVVDTSKSFAEVLCSNEDVQKSASALYSDASKAKVATDQFYSEVDRGLIGYLNDFKKNNPQKFEGLKKIGKGIQIFDSKPLYADGYFTEVDRYYLVTSDEFAVKFLKDNPPNQDTYAPVYCSLWAYQNSKSNITANRYIFLGNAFVGVMAATYLGIPGAIIAAGTTGVAWTFATIEANRALSLTKWAMVDVLSKETALSQIDRANKIIDKAEKTGYVTSLMMGVGALMRATNFGVTE